MSGGGVFVLLAFGAMSFNSIEMLDVSSNYSFPIRDHSHHMLVTFYKENVMHMFITFGIRGEIEPKNSHEGDSLNND